MRVSLRKKEIMEEYKIGLFVAYNGSLFTIKEIKDGMATLGGNIRVSVNKLEPVKIGSPLDSKITVVNDLLRYPSFKKDDFRYYQDYYISKNKSLRDVIADNPQIKYLHQLQDWLALNTEELHLENSIGI